MSGVLAADPGAWAQAITAWVIAVSAVAVALVIFLSRCAIYGTPRPLISSPHCLAG